MNWTTYILSLTFLLCCYPAMAQEDKTLKMSPEQLAGLEADFARFVEENGIDLTRPPSAPNPKQNTTISDTRVLKVLATLDQNDALADLGLLEEQIDEVKSILDEFRSAKEELDAKLVGSDEVARSHFEAQFQGVNRNLCEQLSETLITFQIKELRGSTIGSGGLLALLTKPNMASKYVDLSERQVRQLKEKQEELGKEIQEFIREKRLEASKIFEDELNKEQKRRLVELLGGTVISFSFESASSDSLIRQSGLKLKPHEYMGPRIEAWRELEKDRE